MPIPPGAKIIADQSLIIGSGDAWVGRLNMDVGRDVAAAYKYFLDAFQGQGWTLQSAVRSKTSLLVFTHAGRSATIEFQDAPKLVGGATVTLTMAPLAASRGTERARFGAMSRASGSALKATGPAELGLRTGRQAIP